MKKFLPPTHLFVYLVISVVFHFIFPVKQIIPYPYNLFGVLILITGIILNLWADSIFKKSKTTVKPDQNPTTFIVWGPYAFSRHPMYLGMVFILLGVSVLLGSVSAIIGPMFFVVAMESSFISMEEKSMEEVFGEKYTAYKSKVRRWL